MEFTTMFNTIINLILLARHLICEINYYGVLKRFAAGSTIALVCCLTGCSFVGDFIKSETAAYAEPKDGALAHIRLIGSRNVKVYPNNGCGRTSNSGGGYPAGPQMGGQRKRDLGMPKLPEMPRHYVEIAARANEPITMAFSFYNEQSSLGPAGTGAPGTRSTSSCYVTRSFVPLEGEHYEAVARKLDGRCFVEISRLTQETPEGPWRRTMEPSIEGSLCMTAMPDASLK